MSMAQQTSAGDEKQETILHNRKQVNATITNKTGLSMRLLKKKNWSGRPEDSFPQVIGANDSVTFTHTGPIDYGSKAAVIYAGSNQVAKPCAWLLAWYAPFYVSSETFNQVYVTCGREVTVESMEWDQVEMNLQDAKDSGSHADEATKTAVTAKYDETITETTTLEADFGLM